MIEKEKMEQAKESCIWRKHFENFTFSSEKDSHCHNRKRSILWANQDTFGPVVRDKVAEYACEVIGQVRIAMIKKNTLQKIFRNLWKTGQN